MIPGSKRPVYADVQGTQVLGVRWSVTGGCTLEKQVTQAEPQMVTAPAQGAACTNGTTDPTPESPSFRSAVSCTVKAESIADQTKTALVVLPVCASEIMLSTFPASTVLYQKQYAVIQSDLRGSVNTGVTWEITTNPGKAGSLTGGASNRHAVFSATAAGTYVLTATSAAEPAKKASTTIVVTEHVLPAPTADHTEAVDCTAVGEGKTYEVGPQRAYANLNAVPWNGLIGGDTVRIHNDDTTGTSPTIYRQRISLSASGSSTRPIRICGVPDERGNKPIVDGANATTRRDANWANGYIEDLGIITLYDGLHKLDAIADGEHNIMIEGLHIRNANSGFSFVKQSNSSFRPYDDFAACVRVQTGRNVLVRGNEMDHCGHGVFSNAQTPKGNMVADLTVEGNYIHDWGAVGKETVHAAYLQSIGLQAQFNYFGASRQGATGNVIKTRAVMNFLRWNYVSQPVATTSRAFDMVEPQAFGCYVIPYEFSFVYHGGGHGSDCLSPGKGPDMDPTRADEVAANFEAYHFDYVYGNIMDDSGSNSSFVHYGYDQQVPAGPGNDRRGGMLFYWKNTHLLRLRTGTKMIFDVASPDQGHSGEFPSVTSLNNVFATTGPGDFRWTGALWARIVVDTNWINAGYSLPYRNSADVYQGGTSKSELLSCDVYGQCKPGNGHMVWMRKHVAGTAAATLYVGPRPFNLETFVPDHKIHGLAASLPQEIQDQPSNMEYFPATNTIAPVHDETFLGALDQGLN